MQRRAALKVIASAGLASCPICSSAMAAGPITGYKLEWDYTGPIGPDSWGKIKPEYKACGHGGQQSPVNLTDPIKADMQHIPIYWRAMPLKVENNGHTIEVVAPAGSFIRYAGTRYDLKQFHFHSPSEHVIEGEPFSMEIHFVHSSAAGELLVLGCLVMPGKENAGLAPIWEKMPHRPNTSVEADELLVRPMDLLPAGREFFHYQGSLTTPPCSEIVSWLILAGPIEASPAQIKKFTELFSGNARPVQPKNRRFFLSTF